MKVVEIMFDIKKVKSAQNSELSLTEIFNEFARKSVEDFPELENKFIIYSLPTNTFHGSFAEDDDRARTGTIVLRNCAVRYNKKHPSVAAISGRFDDYFLMAYLSMSHIAENLFHNAKHELGHLVVPFGIEDRHNENFSECAAYAFSFIYQSHQFGDMKKCLEENIWDRSIDLIVKGETDHFSMFVLSELDRLTQSNDLSKLTPVQVVNLAYRLSLQYAPEEEHLLQLSEIFSPVWKEYGTSGEKLSEPILKKCAEIIFEDHGNISNAVYIVGKTFLDPFLNNRQELLTVYVSPKSAANNELKGNFWDNIREKIKERDLQIKETPEQMREQEAIDMQVLGYFDKNPNDKIDPENYESKENQAYLNQQREVFMNKGVQIHPAKVCIVP